MYVASTACLESRAPPSPSSTPCCLLLTSFERRWEQWILRVVVNNTPRPISNDSASVIERQRIQVSFVCVRCLLPLHSLLLTITYPATFQNTAEGMLRGALKYVFEIVGGPIDHVPPVMYEFEINCTKRPDDRENMMARVANLPPILNLS